MRSRKPGFIAASSSRPSRCTSSVGKVGQAARVVEVEVGRDDVAHIVRVETERGELRDRRLGAVGLRAHERREDAPELARVRRVRAPEARVDQDEAVGALDQQAVADELRARQQPSLAGEHARPAGTHRPAVEVVDRTRRGVHVAGRAAPLDD